MTNVYTPAAPNFQGQGIYAQGNPPYTELSRSGKGWNTIITTAVAPLAAIPTTTAHLEIFNNSAGAGSFVMVIDSLHAFELLSTNIVRTASLWAMVTTQKAAPANTALSIFSNSGLPSYATTAASRIITGVAIATGVVANGWRPWGPVEAWSPAPGAGVPPGNSFECPVNGRLEVPPGCSLAMHMVSSAATGTYVFGASWYEIAIPTIQT